MIARDVIREIEAMRDAGLCSQDQASRAIKTARWQARRWKGISVTAAAKRALGILIVAMFAACGTTKEHPTIAIVFDQEGVPADYQATTLAGADAWASLDIPGGAQTVGTRQDNTACIPTWFDGSQPLPCTITIHVTFIPKSELGGAAALTDKARHTMIAIELSGDFLQSVVAHEVGHSVFDTSDHLMPGDVGIMAAAPTSATPTDADIAFAVEHTQGWVMP